MPSTNEKNGAVAVAGVAVVVVIIFVIMNIVNSGAFEKTVYHYRAVPESEPFVEFVKAIYGKDLANITVEDYQQISYLNIIRDCPESDWTNADKYPWRFDYAFSVDGDGAPIDMKSILIESAASVQQADLQVFVNIVSANFGKYGSFLWDDDSSDGINYTNLEKLKYYRGNHFSGLRNAFADPAKIEKIHIEYMRLNSGDDIISQFSGLKSLTIESVNDSTNLLELAKLKELEVLNLEYIVDDQNLNLDFLASLTKLKSLRIVLDHESNFSKTDVFYGLPNIEVLDLTNFNQLKNIDFVKGMPKLKCLKLENCAIVDIEPLRANIALTQLSLNYLRKLTDVSALSTLKSLQKLKLIYVEVDPDAMPNLSNLALLKDVTIDDDYVSAITGMAKLEKLNLSTYYSSHNKIISQLSNLKELSIRLSNFNKNDADLTAIAKLPALENLTITLSDTGIYYVGSLFESDSVKSLAIYNSNFGGEVLCLDISNMADNNTLKALSLNDINIVDINSSNVNKYTKLGGYADQFFKHFSALEELHIANNQIKNLDFVNYLPNLKILDVADNYIDDITPLLGCKNLEFLDCKHNVIKNLELLPDTVHILVEK